MALRSAAAQAATLLRLRVRPDNFWVPLARRFSCTQFASAEVKAGLYYGKSHEWVQVDGDVGTVGISDHAQIAMGDIVFVDFPAKGETFAADDSFGTIESVKAVSDVFIPVSGEVLESNTAVAEDPDTVNKDPYGDGWLIKVKMSNKADLDKLMDDKQYAEFQVSEDH